MQDIWRHAVMMPTISEEEAALAIDESQMYQAGEKIDDDLQYHMSN